MIEFIAWVISCLTVSTAAAYAYHTHKLLHLKYMFISYLAIILLAPYLGPPPESWWILEIFIFGNFVMAGVLFLEARKWKL